MSEYSLQNHEAFDWTGGGQHTLNPTTTTLSSLVDSYATERLQVAGMTVASLEEVRVLSQPLGARVSRGALIPSAGRQAIATKVLYNRLRDEEAATILFSKDPESAFMARAVLSAIAEQQDVVGVCRAARQKRLITNLGGSDSPNDAKFWAQTRFSYKNTNYSSQATGETRRQAYSLAALGALCGLHMVKVKGLDPLHYARPLLPTEALNLHQEQTGAPLPRYDEGPYRHQFGCQVLAVIDGQERHASSLKGGRFAAQNAAAIKLLRAIQQPDKE